MKNLILATLLLTSNAFAGVSIISDLDDTIKITNVMNPVEMTVRGIFSSDTFTGMPQFLAEARSYSDSLHVLTASPPFLSSAIKRTLNRNEIKYDSVAYKNPFLFEDKIEYKVNKIKGIMENSQDQFILLGDDVDKDPEIYEIVKSLYPEKILGIYIHSVRGREIPNGLVQYWTAADLALHEMVAGRMSPSSAEKVMDTLIAETNLENTILDTYNCPTNASVWAWQRETELSEKSAQLATIIKRFCAERMGLSRDVPENELF
jgi:phosphatidate phosphatase APP1